MDELLSFIYYRYELKNYIMLNNRELEIFEFLKIKQECS